METIENAGPVRASLEQSIKPAKSARYVNIVWLIVLFLVVIFVSYIGWGIYKANQEPEMGMAQFMVLASPLETAPQRFNIGRHTMPSVKVLPTLLEAERVQNPSFTAAQLQRAKWMTRTWDTVHKRNETRRDFGNKQGVVSKWLGVVISEALGKDPKAEAMDIAELSNLQVMVGNDLIPPLVSGLLPVFSDADTAKIKVEMARENIVLSEIDMRRAKYFQMKYGAGTMPEKAVDDVELRAEEKADKLTQYGGEEGYQQAVRYGARMTGGAPLSENERLELACNMLNIIANPSLISAAPARR